jgi:UDPglucose 6-dehydrogenase
MNIGVIGYGYVGRAIGRYFARKHNVFLYDKYQTSYASEAHKLSINNCDLAFVAVPTATDTDGWKCNLEELEDVFTWLNIPACIKSTVPPGTTDRLNARLMVPVCFSPEYIGEGIGHEWNEIDSCGFVIIGGSSELGVLVSSAYREINSVVSIYNAPATTAELCKYMENSFLATKVTFVNQFYDIAASLGVDFNALVNLWQLDNRIGLSHCRVTEERGFGGKCLPKDIKAIIAAAKGKTSTDFLDAVVSYNEAIRANSRLGHRLSSDFLSTHELVSDSGSSR